jgi:hypothetical protein
LYSSSGRPPDWLNGHGFGNDRSADGRASRPEVVGVIGVLLSMVGSEENERARLRVDWSGHER